MYETAVMAAPDRLPLVPDRSDAGVRAVRILWPWPVVGRSASHRAVLVHVRPSQQQPPVDQMDNMGLGPRRSREFCRQGRHYHPHDDGEHTRMSPWPVASTYALNTAPEV